MRQFHAAKRKHPGALLFFRMGDFYEMFFEDARVASRELGLTLTSRTKEKDVPMAGVPVRSMEGYLVRLVRAGHSVAICEQLQDPREARGIVERDVVRVVTPGTLVEDETLDGAEPLFVLAVHAAKAGGPIGLAWADVSTGAFRCAQTTWAQFPEDLARIAPAEVIWPDGSEEEEAAREDLRAAIRAQGIPVTLRPPWGFDPATGRRDLCEHLKVSTLEAFGAEALPAALAACGALLGYLRDTQKGALAHLRDLQVVRSDDHLVLDRVTRRTLEITRSLQDGGREGTLLGILDRTGTPMGARLLREWLLEPLLERPAIEERQAAVAELVEDGTRRRSLEETLAGFGDLERICGKVASGRAGARDLTGLACALERIPRLREALEGARAGALCGLSARLDPCTELRARIRATLVDDPPLALQEGGLVRAGFHAEVDELRTLSHGGKEHLAAMERREGERTGIPNLKIGFNKVFGYYIEITRSHVEAVPDDYIRKQTLKNAERYITPELKEYEARVLGAEERVKDLEYRIFLDLRSAVGTELPRLLETASAVARLDVLTSFALVAVERRFTRPELVEPGAEEDCGPLVIVEGRHPMVEAASLDQPFVPNDVRLEPDSSLVLLTGPNMSGKSTYLRQTALIVLMAQVGAFVPAKSARIGIADRIFTRVGSGDDISKGASTFMVEMVETANILRHATRRSLLILDEVGRGTSTFDGLSLAWAICEHIHDRIGARCLFATHYHQLTDLAADLPRARNMNVAVREWGDEIVFLHRIQEGGTDRSYGIHVARLAGVPASVLERAREVLSRVERDEEGLSRRILAVHEAAGGPEGSIPPAGAPLQLSLFDFLQEAGDPGFLDELLALEMDSLPPIEAWKWLQRVRTALRDRERK